MLRSDCIHARAGAIVATLHLPARVTNRAAVVARDIAAWASAATLSDPTAMRAALARAPRTTASFAISPDLRFVAHGMRRVELVRVADGAVLHLESARAGSTLTIAHDDTGAFDGDDVSLSRARIVLSGTREPVDPGRRQTGLISRFMCDP